MQEKGEEKTYWYEQMMVTSDNTKVEQECECINVARNVPLFARALGSLGLSMLLYGKVIRNKSYFVATQHFQLTAKQSSLPVKVRERVK
jgi:hypothetical protein